MPDFSLKMHQIQFWLAPDSAGGSSQRSPDPLARFRGKGRKRRKGEGRCREQGREKDLWWLVLEEGGFAAWSWRWQMPQQIVMCITHISSKEASVVSLLALRLLHLLLLHLLYVSLCLGPHYTSNTHRDRTAWHQSTQRTDIQVWYGIVGFNVPIDTL